jgi:hypothetical protein
VGDHHRLLKTSGVGGGALGQDLYLLFFVFQNSLKELASEYFAITLVIRA